MRICPKCGQTFADDTQGFCLTDGTPLVDGTGQPTLAMSTEGSVTTAVTPRPKGKRRLLIWIIGGLLVVFVSGVALAVIIFFSYRLGRESARNEHTQNVSNAASPKTMPSSAPVSVKPIPESTPSTTAPANSDSETGSDEITPISWTTSGAGFNQDAGTTYRFNCPEKGTAGTVWGSDVYTADSSICTAAVHAGAITLDQGGDITIEFKPGRLVYGSTTRNGITSVTYGQYPHSFVVR